MAEEKEVKANEYALAEVSTSTDFVIVKDGKVFDIRELLIDVANKVERAGLK
jgi:hypothetical protein